MAKANTDSVLNVKSAFIKILQAVLIIAATMVANHFLLAPQQLRQAKEDINEQKLKQWVEARIKEEKMSAVDNHYRIEDLHTALLLLKKDVENHNEKINEIKTDVSKLWQFKANR